MKVSWKIWVPWSLFAIALIIAIFAFMEKGSGSTNNNTVYIDPGSYIIDSCDSGTIRDKTLKYITPNTCYGYVGQKVSDVQSEIKSINNPKITMSPIAIAPICKDPKRKRSPNDYVAAVRLSAAELNQNDCTLFSNSDVQQIYAPCASSTSDQCIAKASTPPCIHGSAYDKRYAAVNP
jgi:hypothetical protein